MSPLAFLARRRAGCRPSRSHRGTLSAAPNFAYELCAKKLADADLAGLDLSSLAPGAEWRRAGQPGDAGCLHPSALRALRPAAARRSPRCTALPNARSAWPSRRSERGPRIDAIERRGARRRAAAPFRPRAAASRSLRVPACGRALPRPRDPHRGRGRMRTARPAGRRLQFRGPSATRGYYPQPGWRRRACFATAGSTRATTPIWSRARSTSPAGSRIVIIRGGRNLYPYELEQAVGALPGVRKGCVAVFASTDPANATERLVVLAETREEDEAAREALRQKINAAAIEVRSACRPTRSCWRRRTAC
jgi:hypothetical protein